MELQVEVHVIMIISILTEYPDTSELHNFLYYGFYFFLNLPFHGVVYIPLKELYLRGCVLSGGCSFHANVAMSLGTAALLGDCDLCLSLLYYLNSCSISLCAWQVLVFSSFIFGIWAFPFLGIYLTFLH